MARRTSPQTKPPLVFWCARKIFASLPFPSTSSFLMNFSLQKILSPTLPSITLQRSSKQSRGIRNIRRKWESFTKLENDSQFVRFFLARRFLAISDLRRASCFAFILKHNECNWNKAHRPRRDDARHRDIAIALRFLVIFIPVFCYEYSFPFEYFVNLSILKRSNYSRNFGKNNFDWLRQTCYRKRL